MMKDDASDAVAAVLFYLNELGYTDATPVSPGGNISCIQSSGAVAHVRHRVSPLNHSDVDDVVKSADAARQQESFIFSSNAYTPSLAKYADKRSVGLFRYDAEGVLHAENEYADSMLTFEVASDEQELMRDIFCGLPTMLLSGDFHTMATHFQGDFTEEGLRQMIEPCLNQHGTVKQLYHDELVMRLPKARIRMDGLAELDDGHIVCVSIIFSADGGMSWLGINSYAHGKKFSRTTLQGNGRNISKAVQREVWRRDQGRCAECGSKEKLEFDHIIAYSKGGSNTERNIQLLCESCNRRKGNDDPG